jgi:hypothetical protein
MINLELRQIKQLAKMLDRALENPELFSEVDDEGYEFFDSSFHSDIKSIRNVIRNTADDQTPF